MKFNEIYENHGATDHLYEEEDPQSYDSRVDEVIDELDESEVEDTDDDDLDLSDMSDVELRLEEANCFKALLENPLFEDTSNFVASRVERKVRKFIKQELSVLLGIHTSPVRETTKIIQKESSFSPDEEKVLKSLAAKVLTKEQAKPEVPTVVPVPEIKPPPETPTVRRAQLQEKPIISKPEAKPQRKPAIEPKVQRRTSKPRVKKENKSQPQDNGPAETINLEINGKVHKVKKPKNDYVAKPKDNPNFIPMPTPDQIANIVQQQVSLSKPTSGITGSILNALNSGRLQYTTPTQEEEE
jgi:hypothetical protein